MKTIIPTLIVCTLFLSSVFAETEAQRVASQIAPLLNENVAAVVHLDCSKVNPTEIAGKLKTIFTKNGYPIEPLDRAMEPLKMVVPTLSALQVRDVYVLTYLPLLRDFPGVLAIPLNKESDAAVVEALIRSISNAPETLKTKTVGKFLLMIPINVHWNDSRNDFAMQIAMQIIEAKPTARPELLTALEMVEGTAAQAVLMPPPYAKRVLEETGANMLPPPFDKVPVNVVANGVRWAVLVVDLDKPQLKLIVCSEHEQAALDLRKALEQAVDSYMETTELSVEFLVFIEKLKVAGTDIRTYLKSFLPIPRENRLELVINESFIEERTKIVADLPAHLLDSAFAVAHQGECTRNLKMIMLSFHTHYDSRNKLPPLYTVDKDGKPLHSWRVAILPYIEQQGLYEAIRKDEPWDSEHNKQFHSQCPAVFQCPQMAAKNPAIKREGLTTYSVVVGKNAYPDGGKDYTFHMITDGSSNTWGVIERQTPVCWMDPTQEVTQEEAMKGIGKSETGIAAPHPSGARRGTLAGMFDGSVRLWAENLSLESLRVFLSRNSGEMPSEKYDAP